VSDLSSKLEPGAQSNIELSKAISLKRIADDMGALSRMIAEARSTFDMSRRIPEVDVNGIETMESVRKRTEARIAAEVAADAEWHVKEKPGLLDRIEVEFHVSDRASLLTDYAYVFAAAWERVSRWRLIEAAP
jgi:hypothetical protein